VAGIFFKKILRIKSGRRWLNLSRASGRSTGMYPLHSIGDTPTSHSEPDAVRAAAANPVLK